MRKRNIDSSAILLGAYIIKVSRNTSSVVQYEKRHAFRVKLNESTFRNPFVAKATDTLTLV